MAKNFKLLKIALIVFGVAALIYGLLFLFVPQFVVKASGSEAVPSGWLRWSGAILIAFGITSLAALKNVTKHQVFIFALALDTLLCGLVLLYALFFDPVTKPWFTIIPAILNLILSVFFWIGWREIATNQEES